MTARVTGGWQPTSGNATETDWEFRDQQGNLLASCTKSFREQAVNWQDLNTEWYTPERDQENLEGSKAMFPGEWFVNPQDPTDWYFCIGTDPETSERIYRKRVVLFAEGVPDRYDDAFSLFNVDIKHSQWHVDDIT